MKKLLLLLALSAVGVLLFAPVAGAQQYYYGGATASPTAMATASATATATASATAMATASASPTATATASPTATATASPTATALPRSGGPLLVLPVTLAASLVLIASGVGALVLVRRRVL